ncbi:MAG: HEAT repeat domain-containing protein [Deltaproteobacteria bacterium]|nr:HEAT repeat domain-containing protein [Deltaproteobacteria bacterium]
MKDCTDIQELVRDLKGSDIFKREKAIEALSNLFDEEVVKHTVSLIREKDPAIRMAAAAVLKKVGGIKLDEIISLLSDENEDVRIYACEILGQIKDERALPYLFQVLKSDVTNVRVAACSALGEFTREDVVDALIALLKESDWISFSAISSLGKIKNRKSVPYLLELLGHENDLIAMASCEALLNFGDRETVKKLAELVKGYGQEKKYAFLKIMVESCDTSSIEILYEEFGEDLFPHLGEAILLEKKRSKKILMFLKYFKKPESVELLLKLLNELGEDHEDYESLLEILAELKEVWAPRINEYLQEEEYSGHIINCAIKEKIRIKEKELVDTFFRSTLEVKRKIVKHIEILCDDGKEVLRLGLEDRDGHIRGDAAEAVGRKKWQEMKFEIVKMVRNDYPDVRVKALRSLISMSKEEAKLEIENLVINGNKEDKKIYVACSSMLSADENLKFVKSLIATDDPEDKKLTAQVIKWFIKDERYIGILENLLEGENIPYEALKIVKDEKIVKFKDRIVEIFNDESRDAWTRYFAISALASFSDKSLLPVFIRALGDENPLIRIAGIEGLVSIKDERALDYIVPLREDMDENVRLEAERAIEILTEATSCADEKHLFSA